MLAAGSIVLIQQFTNEQQDVSLGLNQAGGLEFGEYGPVNQFPEYQYVTGYHCGECEKPLVETVDQIIAVVALPTKPTDTFVKKFAMTPEELAAHDINKMDKEGTDILMAESEQEERDAILAEEEGRQAI